MTRNKPYAEHWLIVRLPGPYWKTKSPVLPHKKVSTAQSLNLGDGVGWSRDFLPDTKCSMLFFAVFYFLVNLMFDLRVKLACGKGDHFNQWVVSAWILMVFLVPYSMISGQNEAYWPVLSLLQKENLSFHFKI